MHLDKYSDLDLPPDAQEALKAISSAMEPLADERDPFKLASSVAEILHSYQRASERHPDNPAVHLVAALLLSLLEYYFQEARHRHLRKAARLQPDDWYARYCLACFYLDQCSHDLGSEKGRTGLRLLSQALERLPEASAYERAWLERELKEATARAERTGGRGHEGSPAETQAHGARLVE